MNGCIQFSTVCRGVGIGRQSEEKLGAEVGVVTLAGRGRRSWGLRLGW